MFCHTSFRVTLSAAISIILVACGGSNSPTASTTSLLTGTAAVGAAISGGQITVFDATGQAVASATTASDGRYTLDVPSSAQAPLVIKLDFAGQELFAVKGSTSSGVANVNQLTQAAVAMLSSSGDPTLVVAEIASGATTIDQSKIDLKNALISAAIKPVTDAISSASGNQPLGDFSTTDFSADGTGIDKLLDAAQVNLAASQAGGRTQTNVEIAFNLATDLNTTIEPMAVSFNGSASAAAVGAQASSITITPSQLPPNQLGTLYDELLVRMNTCYALPLSQRMANSTTINAQICKDLFKNSDPTLFLDGGFGFAGRFNSLSTNPLSSIISKAQTPVLMHNITTNASGVMSGKALLAIRGVDDDGNYLNAAVVAEVFNLNGSAALGFIGDQNPAEFYVNSEVEVVNHPLAPNTNYDYVTSGYSVFAPNYAPTGKTLVMAKLTTPKGDVVTFGKRGSRSQLFICKISELSNGRPTGDCTASPTFVQGIRYLDQALEDQGRSPIELAGIRKNIIYSRTDTSSPIARTQCTAFSGLGLPCPRSEAEIESQRAGGLWQLTYTYTDNTTVTLRARHPVRALSNSELIAATGPDAKAAKLTATTINRFKALNASAVGEGRAPTDWQTTGAGQNPIWAPATGGYQFDWTVDAGQEAPRQVYLAGRVAYYNDGSSRNWWNRPTSSVPTDYRPSFDEKARFKSNLRSFTLDCTLADVSDVSCAGVSGDWASPTDSLNNILQDTTNRNFASGAWMSYANLWTKDSNQRNLKRSYNLYYPE